MLLLEKLEYGRANTITRAGQHGRNALFEHGSGIVGASGLRGDEEACQNVVKLFGTFGHGAEEDQG